MSLWFRGGDSFKGGRGIGGLFRIAKGLFNPLMDTIGRALKSNTGRAIGRALKDQAITTGTNLLADVVAGNDLKQWVDREVENVRQRATLGIQQLNNTCQGYEVESDESEIETKRIPKQKKKKQAKRKTPVKMKTPVKKRGDKEVFVFV